MNDAALEDVLKQNIDNIDSEERENGTNVLDEETVKFDVGDSTSKPASFIC